MLLLAGFRAMVDAASAELALRGHPDVRASHEFAMRAILAGADSATELGHRLSVSKQAAGKTILVLEQRGYVARENDPADGRRKRLILTERGLDMLAHGEAIFGAIRQRWEERIGEGAVSSIERDLRSLVGQGAERLDTAGWLARTSA
jgi:DNA-binding MarR family transcriptional regulator